MADKSRDWVARNLLEARLTNLQFGLRAAQDAPPQIQLGFDFDDTTLIFMKTMPPLQQARGRAVLSNRRFAVQADAGHAEVPGADASTQRAARLSCRTCARSPPMASWVCG